MKVLEFNVGDTAYIHMGGKDNPLRKGTVIRTFQHRHQTLYVIEVQTVIDPVYEVREGEAMSDTPEGPIGLWRR